MSLWGGVDRGAVRCLLVVSALAAVLPATAGAEVRTRTRADGTLEVFNDAPSLPLASSRPLQLRPVPQATWAEWIRTYAGAYGVDPRLVQALMQAESAYNPRAVSRKGAIGLMQLMPGTARELGVSDPFDPEENIRGGVSYLRRMVDLFGGRLEHVLAAYNAGPGAVQRYGGIPPYAETRQYVQRVLGLYRGGGLLVGLSAGGGPARPHGLAQSAAPTPLQRALASRAGSRPAVTSTTASVAAAAPPRERVAKAVTRTGGPGVPPPAGRVVPAVAGGAGAAAGPVPAAAVEPAPAAPAVAGG